MTTKKPPEKLIPLPQGSSEYDERLEEIHQRLRSGAITSAEAEQELLDLTMSQFDPSAFPPSFLERVREAVEVIVDAEPELEDYAAEMKGLTDGGPKREP